MCNDKHILPVFHIMLQMLSWANHDNRLLYVCALITEVKDLPYFTEVEDLPYFRIRQYGSIYLFPNNGHRIKGCELWRLRTKRAEILPTNHFHDKCIMQTLRQRHFLFPKSVFANNNACMLPCLIFRKKVLQKNGKVKRICLLRIATMLCSIEITPCTGTISLIVNPSTLEQCEYV